MFDFVYFGVYTQSNGHFLNSGVSKCPFDCESVWSGFGECRLLALKEGSHVVGLWALMIGNRPVPARIHD